MSNGEALLISACLLGRRCRYDGGSKASDAAIAFAREWESGGAEVFEVCPEELAGLPTPRPAAELRGGGGDAVLAGRAKVERKIDGADLSEEFVAGARASLARAPHATTALLKARSPSCGCGEAWMDGELHPVDGVFAALCRSRGVRVLSDEEIE